MFYTKANSLFIYLIILVLHINFCSKINAQCNTIYVSTSGNDANPGTASLPVASLTTAFNLISNNRTNIKIAIGVYNENTVLNILNNLHIEGGYITTGNIWTKSSNAISTIILSGEETNGNFQNRIGFKADGVSNWTLKNLSITTTNVSGADLLGRGKSNYAVWVHNSSNYTIIYCEITSGNAGNGAVGAVSANGANGENGTKGGSGSCDGNYTCCFGSESAPGGVGGAGGAGGGGTAAGASNSSTTANLNPGADGIGRNGGGGGAGGKGGGFNPPSANYTAINGSYGGGSVSLGQNTSLGTAGIAGNPGGDGTSGGNGQAGSNGGLGNIGLAGIHSGGFFVPLQAGSGTDGTGGQGGAGGSGGGREVCSTCDSGPGNGGGGGGGGGQGGAGGAGGWGGGGSFGIYITNSNIGANFLQNTISVGSAGAGNIGGMGGQGGLGGLGGERDTTCTSQIGEGGAGGTGGAGGNGGQGGTAANGIVAQVCIDGILSNSTLPLPTNLITAAYSGCTNSEIVLTKTNGNWTDLNGGIFVNNLTDSTTSYHIDSNIIVLFYDSLGLKSLMNDTTLFYHFFNIHSNRPLPSFDANMPSIICEGDSLRMSSPEIGEEYEWSVFAENGTSSTPLATYNSSIAFFDSPVLNDTTVYNIRLRIRNACCGWSIPVYFKFQTIPRHINCAVNITKIENITSLQVYPNPTIGHFQIIASEIQNGNYILNLKNIVGQIILTEQLQITNNQLQKEYSINNLPNGIYFLTLETAKIRLITKIHKQY